jgi:O-antigen ligase
LSAAGIAFIALQWLGGPPWYPMGEVMQLPYIGDTLRLRALTASEAMFACVLTGCIPFAIALCASEKNRRWCAAAGAGVVAAAFTVSHAIAGFSVAVLIAAWPSLAAWPRLRRLAVAGVAVVIIGLNFAATISIRSVSSGEGGYTDTSNYFHAVDRGVAHLGGATITYDVMSYFRIKQVALRAFADHPIAGLGLDRFHTATTAAYHDGRLPQLYSEIDPHSTFIGRLAETGIIGGVTLVGLWIAWIGMARDSARSAVGLAAAAAFAGLLVNTTNADVMNFRFLWVIVGLMRGLQDNGLQETALDDTAPNASTPLNDHGHAPR